MPAIAAMAGEYSSDKILLERIAAGDKLAMQALFARHRTPVYRWLYRLVGSETRAEELPVMCSSMCGSRLAAIRGARPSAPGCSRSPASRRSRPAVVASMRRWTRPSRATGADSADDPEITLQKKSRSELVRQAMSKSSPQYREIIDLVYYHEKSVDECAHILGIPAATVKTRMFYARKRLAELVKGA